MLRALALVALLTTTAHADAPKTSLATETPEAGWQHTGFRVGLGLAVGQLVGLRGPPSGHLIGAQLHAGLRLDETWSIYATFEYARAKESGGLSGLRFAGTLDPTWHVTPHVALAVGLGFGGIVEGRTGRTDADPLGSTLDTSYTFPDARHPIASCSGAGVAGLARATYSHVLGPRAATMIELEIIGQETACTDDSGKVEPDTARPILRHQYWAHAGATLLWGVSWR
ncbi:MAG TPA: hypothetical protein VGM88_11515 [Kofleriaceae bacterium]